MLGYFRAINALSNDTHTHKQYYGTTPYAIDQIQGCDGFNPEILDTQAAAQTRVPGEWFTSPDQLNAYLEQSVICQDDCWEMPRPENDASTAGPGPYCRYTWTAACDNTEVTTNAMDQCGNTQSSSFLVRYDAEAPVVTLTLGEFTQSSKWYLGSVRMYATTPSCARHKEASA